MDEKMASAMAERARFVPLLQITNELAATNTISGGQWGKNLFTKAAELWLKRLISVADLAELSWQISAADQANDKHLVTAHAADCEFQLCLSLVPKSNELRMTILNSGEPAYDASVHALRNIHALKSVVDHIRLDPEEVRARAAAASEWLFGGMEE